MQFPLTPPYRCRLTKSPVAAVLKPTVLAACIVALMGQSLNASSVTWDGGGANALWGTANNWDTNTLPASVDDITFGSGFTSGSPSLGGIDYTVNSLAFNGSTAISLLTGSGSPTITLTSGLLTKTTAAAVTIAPNILLGADAVWSNTSTATANALKVTGSISDGAGSYGLTVAGGGHVWLYASNSFDGGVTVNSGNLGVYNNGALGTGTLKIQGASAVFYTADTISNDIVFNSPTGFTGFYSGSYKSTTNNFSTTFTGSITGAMNNQQLRVGGNARTWIFGTINLTGMQSQGLQLVPEEASGSSSYIFSSTPTLSNGRIQLGATSAAGAQGNLLVNTATTFNVTRITQNSGGGKDTIGGIHSSGTATFSQSEGILLNDVAAGQVNLITLNAGATTDFASLLDDGANSVGVTINGTFRQVDTAASANQNAAVYMTQAPTGKVRLSKSTGNTYDGGTVVSAGTLLVANTSGSATGTGSVSVESGATLGGTGIIAPGTGGAVSMKSGATLAPGEGIGQIRFNGAGTAAAVLSLEAGAAFSFDLGAPGTSDSVAMWNYSLGDLVLNGNVVNFTNLGGLAEGTYTLFSFFSDSGTTLTASGLSSGLTIGTGLESYSGSHFVYGPDSVSLVVAVPEPSTIWLLVAVGVLGLCKMKMTSVSNGRSLAFGFRKVNGFTLMEVLAAVAVIALLAALILPAMQNLRQKGFSILCLQNLRTLAVAYSQYRADRDGLPLPRGVTSTDPDSENGHNFAGISLLRQYYQGGAGPYVFTSKGKYIEVKTEKCPMSAIRKETTTANYNFIAKDNYLSYTGNNAVRMDLYFSNHSKTPLMWESWSINWGANPYMPMRHSGKVNMAFLDGHVESIAGTDGRLYKGYIESIYKTGNVDETKQGSGIALARETYP